MQRGPQAFCVPLPPEMGWAGPSQTLWAGMSFRPSIELNTHTDTQTQGYCLCSCRAVGWGWISTAFDRTWLTLGDIKLGLMGFAYMQLPACSQHW